MGKQDHPSGTKWFYASAAETVGPVSRDELAALVRQRTIDGDTPIWCDGMADWASLRDSGVFPVKPASSPPPRPTPPLTDDPNLYRDGPVVISKSLARFGKTSYPIGSIGSVRIDAPNRVPPILAAVLAAGIGLLLLVDQKENSAGVVVLLVSLLFFVAAMMRPYSLVLRTASEDQQAFESRKADEIMKIKRAIEQAVALRG